MMMENIKKYIPKNSKVDFCNNVAFFEASVLEIREIVKDLHRNKNLSLKLITATDEREEQGYFKIWYVFGVLKENAFIIPFIQLKNTEEFPSMVSSIHAVWNHEKKIQTFFGLSPVGHPDPRPILLHENWPAQVFPLRKDFDWKTRPEEAQATYLFQKVAGEGIYEIPVGPIHAGIIEPGHFRFSVAGEKIVFLEPRLGFTHKGSEKLFEVLPIPSKIRLSEKISGDSSFSHSLAFCQAVEQLMEIKVPTRALYLRVIYAELERLANHFGDIGMIMLDTGFNFGGAQGARLREMTMQINERLTGSRFLRGVNKVGGVAKDIAITEKSRLSDELSKIDKDFCEIIAVEENSTSLLNRLKGTGVLLQKVGRDRGVVGVAAKAVGIQIDGRFDFPYAAYDQLSLGEIKTEQDGDVAARMSVRIKEVRSSIEIIQQALRKIPEGPIGASVENTPLKKNALAVSLVEGWRGEIVYFLTTDVFGNISRVVPNDPSFVNWTVLGTVSFDNIVPDFPLINKSFNLSYSGNDL
ncbi:MAG: NADH-quinone oxidoreductase subunit C [Deltaproteobacteria bacterium]|nr:NADH-quinone oxidoreductase subunit C [Deltaproteobacteria bacterium]